MNEKKLEEYLRKYTGSSKQTDQVTANRLEAIKEIFEEEN